MPEKLLVAPVQVPMMDPRTGQITPAWQEYFSLLDSKQASNETRINALENP